MRGLTYIVFSYFSPLIAQIPSSSFINLLHNSPPLLVEFGTDFTPFAPCSRLFPSPRLLILKRVHPLLGYYTDESM